MTLLTAAAWLLLTQGCMVNRLAGNHLIAAPNLQFRSAAKQWTTIWTNLLPRITTNSLRTFAVPVGPPNARLVVVEVPPGDYHRRFASQIKTNGDGTKQFTLFMQVREERTFRPLTIPTTIVLLHGYAMSKESMLPWAITIAQAGYRVILLDLRGHGASSGEHITFGSLEVKDLRQALDHLIALGACDRNVGVMGISYGAVMALHWAAADDRVRTVVAVAPYDQPDEAIYRFIEMQNLPLPKRLLRRAVAGAASRLEIEWEDWAATTAMRGINQPVLLIGGDHDTISQPDDIRALESMASGEVRSVVLPGIDHIVVSVSVEALEEPIKEWLQQHLATE